MGLVLVGTHRTNSSSGALGYFTSKAASLHHLICILCATTRPIVAPYGGKEARIGTNPISMAFPSLKGSVVFDATPSQWAFYGIVDAAAKNKPIPLGVALDSKGNSTTDPQEAMKGCLLPKGVFGWGIGVAVHLLSGLLVQALNDRNDVNNWGHLMILINPNLFDDGNQIFQEKLDEFQKWISQTPSQDGFDRVYLPGKRGDELTARNMENGDLEISDNVYNYLMATN